MAANSNPNSLIHENANITSPPLLDHQQSTTALRLLIVDHDPANLKLIQDLAFQCNYIVTTCYEGSQALNLLREKRECFDVVLCDFHMPGIIDDTHLFEHLLQEFNIPVVVMCSMDDASSSSAVMESMMKKEKGACYNLVKPIREEDLSNIWQNVMMEKTLTRKEDYCDDDGSEGTVNKKKRRSVSIEERDDNHDHVQQPNTPNKKPRFVWTNERHRMFVDAVLQLGIDKAVPKKIMELMDMPQLTRENVASHLQKFRIHMRKKSEESQQIIREANNNTSSSLKTTNHNNAQITQTLPLARPYYSDLAAAANVADYPFYQPQPAIPDATFEFPNNNNPLFGGVMNNNGIIGRLDHQSNNNHGRSIIMLNLLQPQQSSLMMQNNYPHSSSNLFQQSDYYPMPTPPPHQTCDDEAPFQVGMSCGRSPLFDYSSTPLLHHQMNNSLLGQDSGSIAQFHGGYTTAPASASPSSLSPAGFFSSTTHHHNQQQLPNYPTSLAIAAAGALSYLSNSSAATQVPTALYGSSSSLFDDYQLGQALFQG
ncbi:hypothetical protein PIB30_009484 [Stylosanthes scabra]|uniref:Response regulatory domain-containing protein n=1 Tax=Stylosanthes scabra TaxID=79078 RepID=A0ABU6Y1T6_9FABA|nr:hypothetical protein [Stylosanthes scabra]